VRKAKKKINLVFTFNFTCLYFKSGKYLCQKPISSFKNWSKI